MTPGFEGGYDSALSYLFSKRRMGMKYGLERIRGLLRAMGNPESSFRTVHVVGTNGKGTTTAILAETATRLGIRTGRFTSPHLLDYRERVSVDGEWIPPDAVMRFLQLFGDDIESLSATFFEVTTALAAWWFAQRDVRLAVVEAGLGGRLDATRTFGGCATLLTGVRLEHSRILGDTVELIAAEKVAIADPGTVLVSSRQPEGVEGVLQGAERSRGLRRLVPQTAPANPYRGGPGANADLAWAAAEELLDLPPKELLAAFTDACENLYWPGRQDMRPGEVDILFDVAHNPQSMEALLETVGKLEPPLPAVVGFLRDKMHARMSDQLAGFLDPVVATTPADPDRALEAEGLAEGLRSRGVRCRAVADIAEAVEACREDALASGASTMVVTGSFFVVGEAMLACQRRGWTEIPGLSEQMDSADGG